MQSNELLAAIASAADDSPPRRPFHERAPAVPAGRRPTSATAPTDLLLSPLFSVSDAKSEAVQTVLEVHGRSYSIEYRGLALTQAHLSVLLLVLHDLRGRDVDGFVRLERWRAIDALGWTKNVASVDRLASLLQQLCDAAIEYRRASDHGWLGGTRLVLRAKPVALDERSRATAWDVQLDPDLASWLRVHTFIDLRERAALGRNKLATWLHAFVAANDCRTPFEFSALQRLSGSAMRDYRDFKRRCIEAANAVCSATGWRYERVRGGLRFDKRKAH